MSPTHLAPLCLVTVVVALSACGRTPVTESAVLDAPEPLRTYVSSPPPTLPRTGAAFPLLPAPLHVEVSTRGAGGPVLELAEVSRPPAPDQVTAVVVEPVSAALVSSVPATASAHAPAGAASLASACATGRLVAPEGYSGAALGAGTHLIRHQVRRGESWWLYRRRSGVHYTTFAKLNSLPLSTVTAGNGLVAGELIWLAKPPVVLC